MPCSFVTELGKLRKSSAESVENTGSFNDFKKYLHVRRPVEDKMRDLLRKVNSHQKKCLIMLCGSAGDGKSHLMSRMKNSDSEGLLKDFDVYNDATESSAPDLTSIDTLADKLAPFNDENYSNDDAVKMIIAINLGTLNNFILSEKGKKFSRLKKYVEVNEIFSGYGDQVNSSSDNAFKHVSFSDYQVFSLCDGGIDTAFLEQLLEKVFLPSNDNPFYKAYMDNSSCPSCSRCPVRHNYEFLMTPAPQRNIIKRIVEVVVKDKAIVSTREVLNFIYDILVHPDFRRSMCNASSAKIRYVLDYINYTTPMLLNEYDDISAILNAVRSHDSLKTRSEHMDADVSYFNALDDIGVVLTEAAEETPYMELVEITDDIGVLGAAKPELKRQIYKFIIRLKEMRSANEEPRHQHLRDYIQYLYDQNSGNEKKLLKLYKMATKAILGWNGSFEEADCICIDDSNEHFWILEQLYIEPVISKHKPVINGAIERFPPNIKLRFKKDNADDANAEEISIDYALYELITNMSQGYRPTVKDKNRHTEFASFIQRLIELGNKSSRVIILPKDHGEKFKIVFGKTAFGFDFKVV